MFELGFFASTGFFALAACAIVLHTALACNQRNVQTTVTSVLGISSGILVVCSPAAWKVIAFVLIQYLYQTWAIALKRKIPTLLLVVPSLLPMVIIKLGVAPSEILGIVGMSFLTFRAVQVLIDEEEPADLLSYASFMLYFPTLLMGPLARFQNFKQSLIESSQRGFNPTLFEAGLRAFAVGVLYRFVLAELSLTHGLNQVSAGALSALWDPALYSIYLFFDFAGYSLLALGLSQMLGIDVGRNFDRPWLATSPQDFWKRWHISLSDWLRDYVFRPAYRALRTTALGRKHPLAIQNSALFLSLFIMGIWNGLQFHYVLSGILFGSFTVIHNTILFYRRGKDPFSAPMRWAGRITTITSAIFSLWVFSGRPIYPVLPSTSDSYTLLINLTADASTGQHISVKGSTGLLFIKQPKDPIWRRVEPSVDISSYALAEFAVVSDLQYVRVGPLPDIDAHTKSCRDDFKSQAHYFGASYGWGLEGQWDASKCELRAITVRHLASGKSYNLEKSHAEQITKGYFHLHGQVATHLGNRNLDEGEYEITATLSIKQPIMSHSSQVMYQIEGAIPEQHRTISTTLTHTEPPR